MREICTSGSTRGEEVAPLRRPLSYSTGSEWVRTGDIGNTFVRRGEPENWGICPGRRGTRLSEILPFIHYARLITFSCYGSHLHWEYCFTDRYCREKGTPDA